LKIKFKYLVFFLFLHIFSFAAQDSLICRFTGKFKEEGGLGFKFLNGNFKIDLSEIQLNQKLYVKYILSFKNEFIHKNYNDSLWNISLLKNANLDQIKSNEITIKFYYQFTNESKENTVLLKLNHIGASEIYLDGKLIKNYGFPSYNKSNEICEIPGNEPLVIKRTDTLIHVLCFRYSNFHKFNSTVLNNGISIDFYNVPSFQKINQTLTLISYFLLAIGIFFIALSTVYYNLYVSYKILKYNLYYFIFLLSLGLTILTPFLYRVVNNSFLLLIIEKLNSFLIPFCSISLTLMVYLIFQLKKNWYYYLLLVISTLFLITEILNLTGFSILFYSIIVIYCYIGITVIAIKALLKKLKGSKYLGVGILSFTVFIILAIISSIYFDNLIYFCVLFSLSILSIPLFMSSFLSNQFAIINNSLFKELENNKILADEKQNILQNQNKLLEEQVIIRTKQIEEQKLELFVKNKEITESITYSKHIQQALLPNEGEIENELKNCFVLYKPKDIVSGDFYWFKKINDNEFLLAAADCTGHGVPGALTSLIAIESLNTAFEKYKSPELILSETNKLMKQKLKQNISNSAKDGMDIALIKIKFNEQGANVLYSGANRPVWFIKNNETTICEIKATKTAIGGFTSDDQVFDIHELSFNKNDCIFMFSDGYADQFGQEKNKKMTTKKFKEILVLNKNLSIQNLNDYLDSFFKNFKGNLEQLDDVLVIGLKF
jgi:serine phosphatase RsbU (regulator of sigma subunit)